MLIIYVTFFIILPYVTMTCKFLDDIRNRKCDETGSSFLHNDLLWTSLSEIVGHVSDHTDKHN